MKITITKGDTSIAIERNDMDISEIFDGFIYCLFGVNYELSDIEGHIIHIAKQIQEKQNQEDGGHKSVIPL